MLFENTKPIKDDPVETQVERTEIEDSPWKNLWLIFSSLRVELKLTRIKMWKNRLQRVLLKTQNSFKEMIKISSPWDLIAANLF
jgi:hypothetical protein